MALKRRDPQAALRRLLAASNARPGRSYYGGGRGALVPIVFPPTNPPVVTPPPPVAVAPVFTSPPVLSSTTPMVGETITATPGTVTGTAPILRAYAWRRAGSPTVLSTALSYTFASLDEGLAFTFTDTASNAADSVATSASTAAVAPFVPPTPPAPAPTVSFTAPPSDGVEGTAMTVSVATGGATGNVLFRLNRAGFTEAEATIPISGNAASWTFARPAAASGYSVRVDVSGPGGAGNRTSGQFTTTAAPVALVPSARITGPTEVEVGATAVFAIDLTNIATGYVQFSRQGTPIGARSTRTGDGAVGFIPGETGNHSVQVWTQPVGGDFLAGFAFAAFATPTDTSAGSTTTPAGSTTLAAGRTT